MNRATRRVVPFLVLLLAGCSTAPVSFQGVAPPGLETAYRCAVAQLNLMDYTIEDGNLEAGFVRARSRRPAPCRNCSPGPPITTY